ncbi:MAG: peptide-methionine (S)-S-oxide reductase MsrA [Dokdonella sp.]|uniref:peptide-methionine (S)-S-oxide reductase MsrA n=1 Tax=Dokdonella sp. TaxID=2291710 RepID=UPI003267DAA6
MKTRSDSRFPSLVRLLPMACALAISASWVGLMVWQVPATGGERAVLVPAPAVDEAISSSSSEKAIFAGGCFWGVQGVFQHVQGVSKAVSGYAGGQAADAHYERVGLGNTGHAESVEVTFDPHKISYGQLLQIYFSVAHDPTELNRQGPDTGTQYRSAIFPVDQGQQKVAEAYVSQLGKAGVYPAPIVTTIEMGKSFYTAEGYHQDFLVNNPTYPYIVANDLPKVENLKQMFPDRYRSEATLVASSVR